MTAGTLTGRVHRLPEEILPGTVLGAAVVIDVLRATTTICHALAAGAAAVLPCVEASEAFRGKVDYPPGACLLGGERGGIKIAGFDLGNSPAEYEPSVVGGKTILFSTTNGTRAIAAAAGAGRILLAALVNREAICRALASERAIDILCAGTDGRVTDEDLLAAGAIVERLEKLNAAPRSWNVAAIEARDAWRALHDDEAAIVDALCGSAGGRNLIELGYDRDIFAAAQLDSLDVVPMVEAEGLVLRAH